MTWLLAQPTPAQALPGLTVLQQVLVTLGMVGGVVALGAYLWGQFRSGTSKASAETITAQKEYISTLEHQNAAIKIEAATCSQELAKVQGALEQMNTQNAELRALIMGETLPRAMQEAFSGVVERVLEEVSTTAQRNLKAYVEAFAAMESSYLVPIQNKLDDLQDTVDRRTSQDDDFEEPDRRKGE